MTLTLLLDLDDTLLNTNQDVFFPTYVRALATNLAPQVNPEVLTRALLSATNVMYASADFSRTLQEVFDAAFLPQIGLTRAELHAAAEIFYDTIFPTLQSMTAPKPEAKRLVEWAFAQGHRVAIATDPILPRHATYQRICWAGFAPEQFELFSSYEHFSFTKHHPAYYAEILGRLGWPDGPVLMVGNDMERDILPAKKLGLATYFVNGESTPPEENIAHGSLSDLSKWLEAIEPSALIPSFKSVDAVLGILSATPAVMNGLARECAPAAWLHKSAPDDWSLTELVCHLRDTEREIHHAQIKLFEEQGEPFIPRPDTGVWASQRDYLHEDGADALREFNEARRETMVSLKNISAEDWQRKARHAIFGPTNFLEVVRFIADHDRMHIQQAWGVIKKI